jgi:4a-hydroxytetrahydrobiopterin dehydratase
MLTLAEINQEMSSLEGWSLEGSSISKSFEFTNFKESLDFVNKVGEIAEKAQHHPDILINYNQVRLSLSTHSEGGLTRKDFSLAKEIDMI